jgi:hypothetical protein
MRELVDGSSSITSLGLLFFITTQEYLFIYSTGITYNLIKHKVMKVTLLLVPDTTDVGTNVVLHNADLNRVSVYCSNAVGLKICHFCRFALNVMFVRRVALSFASAVDNNNFRPRIVNLHLSRSVNLNYSKDRVCLGSTRH